MNLSTFVRPPLVWLLVAESLLIAALGLVTWQVWQHRVAPVATAVMPRAPAPPPGTARGRVPAAPTQAPVAGAPHPAPTPGLRTDGAFLSRELVELNQVEATFEKLEWRVTSAIADGMQRYVDGVVLPSIDRAERSRR
jgi:hypothetical protein